jgi:hypothetical protein
MHVINVPYHRTTRMYQGIQHISSISYRTYMNDRGAVITLHSTITISVR